MEDFNWMVASLILVAYCLIDWLFTIYTVSIVGRKKLRAANAGTLIYLLTSFGVINYVRDWRYLAPMIIGAWIGTYLSVWHEERKSRRRPLP